MKIKIVSFLTVFYLMNTSCVTRPPKHIETLPSHPKTKSNHKHRV